MYIPRQKVINIFLKLCLQLLESEGTMTCAGDFNVLLDHKIDTTSTRRSKTHLSKFMNVSLKEQGMVDVWRELHPTEKDYTHYSNTHNTHSRID